MVIGVTGRAGCGKSTLANALKERGLNVIELDKVGHEVLEEIKDELKRAFGANVILNNRVNRKYLGELVFKDPEKLKMLNALTHPLIKKKVVDIITKVRGHIVIDGAMLHQIGLKEYCDLTIFIDCSEEIALQRLIKRGIDEEKARKILFSQRAIEEYAKESDFLYINDREPQKLIESVIKILSACGVVL
ncbi:dephospho-CoA kinase [Kosmotoga pacifica]|uniref:Dephospho-CoA kinase n=1 Tax=Kosmotoga pacifica TaxID=1330330 RepID=A0A0G2ZDK3_9BACT|nr:dephospho-CoA kinase [Kosmotoga pacifica]AKI96903.1 hypothetical protein IX53_02665 [Kosmotoga pacifica]